MKRLSGSKAFKWGVSLIAALLLAMGLSTIAFADAGDPPTTGKTAKENGDGTFKLELSITGDADPQESSEASAVNIVIVYDISQSMTNRAGSSRNTRADEAENIMYHFIDDLMEYQNAAKDNIHVSLVTFGLTASTPQGWTTDVQGVRNRFDEGTGENRNPYNFTYNSYGTNWDHALRTAQNLVNNPPSASADAPTFVIMLTDGAPTATGNSGSDAISPTGASLAQLRTRYAAACTPAYNISQATTATGGDFFSIYAFGTEADLLDDLMYYAKNNEHRGGNINNVTDETIPTPNYYNAAETSQLEEAISSIFEKVVQAMGISQVTITDGTTSNVETTTELDVELLEVIEEYQYWLSIPLIGGKFTRIDIHGNTVEYTVVDNADGTCTITWGDKSVTVDGKVTGNTLKYEWKEANDLYDYDPPAAHLQGSDVVWDLKSVGTLLDGVTYSVTFDVYPSQTTLDIIADMENDPWSEDDPGAWGDLDPNIQKYISKDGKLSTNTTASVSYVDTRTGESGDDTIKNPDPVSSEAVESLLISKEWENELDRQGEQDLTLNVLRDDEPTYTVDLNSGNDWEGSVYISIGIMRTDGDEIEILAPGHNFTFTEPEELTYHWELDVPVVRPMMIDGDLKMLIMVDEKHEPSEGATVYEDLFGDGEDYYVGGAGTAELTATNYRRSSLNLTKDVDNDSAPDAKFPFTLNIVNSAAPEDEPQDDPKHETDYWVWFSIRDASNARVYDAVVDGATAEIDEETGQPTSYYYAPSGSDIKVELKEGYNLRITNLPTDTTYTITEDTLPTAFIYKDTELTITEGEGTDSTFEPGRTTTGTIESTNTQYTVTYTNDYALVDVTVDKVWDDAGDYDELRPDDLELTLKADGDAVTDVDDPEVVKDGDTWTYTWSDVPKFTDAGDEIDYTIEEAGVPEGYTCVETEVDADGEIVNTHVPVVDIDVTKIWQGPEAEAPISLKANGTEVGTITLPNEGSNTYTFEDMPRFDENGEITYTVTEDVPDGYTTEGATGSVDEGFEIVNTYSASGEIQLQVTKSLEYPTLAAEQFSFQLIGPDGEVVEVKQNDAQGAVLFTPLTFTSEDLYGDDADDGDDEGDDTTADGDDEGDSDGETTGPTTKEIVYTIVEVDESADNPGYAYDTHTVTATITLSDEVPQGGEPGDMTVTVVYTPDSEFINFYDATGAATIVATKVLDGRDLAADEFQFELLDEGGETVGTASNAADGSVTFPDIEYGLNDVGTYTYTVKEVIPENPDEDIEYDDSEFTVTVTVSDDEHSGELAVSVDKTAADLTFTNTYEPPFEPTPAISDPPVDKIVKGNPDTDATFTFQMKAADPSSPMPDGSVDGVKTATIKGTGSNEFGNMYYYEPGTHVYYLNEVNDGQDGYTYDTTQYTLTVEVTADEIGNLTATETVTDGEGRTVERATFTNVYTKESAQTGDSGMQVGMVALGVAVVAGIAAVGAYRRRRD